MTINDFIDSVTIALHNQFGNDYKYYVEEMEQNAKKPCFVVGVLNPMIRSTNARRYVRTCPMVLHYFTEKENTLDAKKDCFGISEQLWQTLEYLTVNDCVLRGESISWELVDGVLEFFITYSYPIYKVSETIYMEDGTYNETPIRKE